MKSVFLVVKGDYSEYSVMCVCPTREVAEAVAEKFNAGKEEWQSEAGVEEVNFLENPNEALRRTWYCVQIDEEGNERGRSMYNDWNFNPKFSERAMPHYAESTRGYDVALKAARDKLAEAKAKREGLI